MSAATMLTARFSDIQTLLKLLAESNSTIFARHQPRLVPCHTIHLLRNGG